MDMLGSTQREKKRKHVIANTKTNQNTIIIDEVVSRKTEVGNFFVTT